MENYQDALKILGLEHGASEEDIKRAYFHLVRKYTPEKDPEAFQKIHEAYLLVKDAEKKAEYTFHDLSIGQLPEIHLSLKIIRPENIPVETGSLFSDEKVGLLNFIDGKLGTIKSSKNRKNTSKDSKREETNKQKSLL